MGGRPKRCTGGRRNNEPSLSNFEQSTLGWKHFKWPQQTQGFQEHLLTAILSNDEAPVVEKPVCTVSVVFAEVMWVSIRGSGCRHMWFPILQQLNLNSRKQYWHRSSFDIGLCAKGRA